MPALPDLQQQSARYRCAAHPKGRLTVSMFGPHPVLFCPSCKRPPANLVGNDSVTHTYMTGGALPAAIHNHMERKFGARTMTTETGLVLRDPTPTDIAKVGERFAAQLPTFKPEAWKALSQADKNLAAKLCLAGFQPFHFTVTSYNTKDGPVASLYLNLAGREFNAQQAMRHTYGGVEVRPMTAQEREDWQLEEGEVGAVATLYKVQGGQRFAFMQDIGRAGGSRDAGEEKQGRNGTYIAGGNPIARKNRQEQALARARARVLINGAPLGVPISTFDSQLGVVLEEVQPEPQHQALSEPAPYAEPVMVSDEPVFADGSPLLQGEGSGEGDDEPTDAVFADLPDADPETGELRSPPERTKRDILPNDPLVVETLERAKAEGLTKEDAGKLLYDGVKASAALIAMLRDGYDPHEVVAAIQGMKEGGVQQQLA